MMFTAFTVVVPISRSFVVFQGDEYSSSEEITTCIIPPAIVLMDTNVPSRFDCFTSASTSIWESPLNVDVGSMVNIHFSLSLVNLYGVNKRGLPPFGAPTARILPFSDKLTDFPNQSFFSRFPLKTHGFPVFILMSPIFCH